MGIFKIESVPFEINNGVVCFSYLQHVDNLASGNFTYLDHLKRFCDVEIAFSESANAQKSTPFFGKKNLVPHYGGSL